MLKKINNNLNLFIIFSFFLIFLILINQTSLYLLMPDDAFYYLSIAQNYNDYYMFTFDSGVTLTNGFHILWMYILIILDYFFNNKNILIVIIYLQIILSLLSLLVIFRLKQFLNINSFFIIIFLTSYSFVNNIISGTEWSVTLLIHSLIFFFLQLNNKYKSIILFLLGLLGNLSRSDFGATSFFLFLGSIILYYYKKNNNYLIPTFSLFLGSFFGLIIFLIHHYGIDNSHIQGSASIKRMWTEATGISPIPIIFQIIRSFIFLPKLSDLLNFNLNFLKFEYLNYLNLILFLLIIILFFLLKNNFHKMYKYIKKMNDAYFFIYVSSILIILFYIVFYSFNSQATQSWYSIHFTLPLLFIFSPIYNLIFKKYNLIAIVFTIIVISFNILFILKTFPTYNQNESSIRFGNLIKEKYSSYLVALPDNGLINYISGNKIVNIDGIANNDILKYKPENFHCFLLDYKIEYFTFFGGNNHKFFKLKDLDTYSKIIENNFKLRKIDLLKIEAFNECTSTT